MSPKVSVILTTYNGSSRGYLSSAIESVLIQSYQNFELLIIDDGSTDDTKKTCSSYLENDRIRYVYQENTGLAAARNTGIRASSAGLICFIDDDDLWKTKKLERQMSFVNARLRNVHNWGLVFTWTELIDEDGKIIGYRGHGEGGFLYSRLFFGNTVDSPSSVLVKREVFDKVGLFDEFYRRCQDWDMWLRISKYYQIFPIKEYLVQYREHKNRLSSDNKEIFYYENAVLKKALSTAPDNIDPQKVYASCYVNRSIAHFSLGEYADFRRMLRRGLRLSPQVITLEHIFYLVISFWGNSLIGFIKRTKREIHKTLIEHKVRENL
ncbi:MAG: glycosyltransferase [Deltaproteobacteria bacterium]|jgi:glycosyltransferase involved in cell wall biosynthesis|nr:glycosyltransferase [Deltaproteobacteria bacterium]MDH3898037.1 glycosyltransferase [Deltaproteobacteria bacterium]